VDLAKLIESQAKLATESGASPDDAGTAAAALRRPVELQQAQADRVRNRIASLETSRAALVDSIDAELKALKADLDARESQIKAVGKQLDGAGKALPASPPAPPRKVERQGFAAAADKTARRKPAAKRAKPK